MREVYVYHQELAVEQRFGWSIHERIHGAAGWEAMDLPAPAGKGFMARFRCVPCHAMRRSCMCHAACGFGFGHGGVTVAVRVQSQWGRSTVSVPGRGMSRAIGVGFDFSHEKKSILNLKLLNIS